MPSDSTTPRTRAPRRDAAENREAILLAAASILNSDPTASLEAIAVEAGLSRRAFYGHFATRDDLLRELALHGAARINATLDGHESDDDEGSGDPGSELALLGARLWDEVDHVRVMALLTLRGPQSTLLGDALAPLRHRVRRLVQRGVDAGAFRDDVPVARLSRLIESAAISVLDEGTRHGLSSAEGRRLVVLSVLGIAGFGHREAHDILTRTLTKAAR
ncbi:TetR/AcrR family transcriptional regulator [Frondihabitans cladoniiphilus]|uniref:HTH tetR-type domain-containing protein n=1 Tax=Frondihabitans cladoniiphilus TaxID=715785 RepID=A0ABP8W4M1_9MICO